MLERTTAGAENYYQVLAGYMERRRWTPEEQTEMFRYIGHSMMSAESALEVLYMADAVRGRQDIECLTHEHNYDVDL